LSPGCGVNAGWRTNPIDTTWSGRGLTPKWLAEKEKAGAKREEFLIKRK
jgi:DNA-binding protein H-NS